jgi:DNA-binding winged helix-turn-helix (wHTH) protein
VDGATRQLRRDERDVHVSRKAFDVLCLLMARRPRVVSKEELFKAIWPDTYVTEANLNVVIGEIRRALGDNAQAPQFVRTAHGVGYAFCAEAVDLDASSPAVTSSVRAWLVAGDRTYQLAPGENVIGRDTQCDVWLDDASISRRHAAVRLSVAGAFLRDLQSTNGTFVRRRRVTGEAPLADADRITIGEVELEFRQPAGQQPATKRIRPKK